MWGNTFLASGRIQGIVLYTGKENRSAMNSREPRNKMGKMDYELNYLSKVLCLVMCGLSFIIVICSGF